MLKGVGMTKSWNDKGNFSKTEKFYRLLSVVAEVKLGITREISGFPTKKLGYYGVSFLRIIWHVPEYFLIFGKEKEKDFQ